MEEELETEIVIMPTLWPLVTTEVVDMVIYGATNKDKKLASRQLCFLGFC